MMSCDYHLICEADSQHTFIGLALSLQIQASGGKGENIEART